MAGVQISSPELDPASVMLGRPPLEADHPHGARLAAVGDRGLEPLAAVEVLGLREVARVRQVGDVPSIINNQEQGDTCQYYQVPTCLAPESSEEAVRRKPLNARRLLMDQSEY